MTRAHPRPRYILLEGHWLMDEVLYLLIELYWCQIGRKVKSLQTPLILHLNLPHQNKLSQSISSVAPRGLHFVPLFQMNAAYSPWKQLLL